MRKITFLVTFVLFSIFSFAQNLQTSSELKSVKVLNSINNLSCGAKAIVDSLHYDGINDSAIGTDSEATMGAYAFFPAAVLTSHNALGRTITSIKLYINDLSYVTSSSIKIFSDQGVTSLVSQAFTPQSGWNQVFLSTPLSIPATDLYIGYEVVVTGGYPLGCDGAAAPNPNGNWLDFGSAWAHLDEINDLLTYNWNIRAMVDKGVLADAELVELTLPSPSCELLENIPVTIKVKNRGTSPISNVPVSFKKGVDGVSVNETIAGPIARDSTVSYTFTDYADFSVSGQLDSVQAKVSLENDELSGNNVSDWVSTYSITPVSIPYSVDFENLDEIINWKTIDGNEDGESWFIGNSTLLAHEGSGVAALNSNDSIALNDWFISTCINLTQGYYIISYWYRTQDAQHPENLKIAYGSEQSAAGMTNVLNDHPGITNNTYVKGQSIFSVATTGTYYFGIHGYSEANSNRLLVDDISIEVSTDITETNLTSKIYPNPAKNNIRVESNQIIKMIRILNVLGQEVYSKTLSNYGTEVNVSNFHSGIYFVNIETNKGVTTQRISVIK